VKRGGSLSLGTLSSSRGRPRLEDDAGDRGPPGRGERVPDVAKPHPDQRQTDPNEYRYRRACGPIDGAHGSSVSLSHWPAAGFPRNLVPLPSPAPGGGDKKLLVESF